MSEFRTASIPGAISKYGRFRRLVEAARELIGTGKCVEIDVDTEQFASLRASLYSNRYLKSGERVHTTRRGNVAFVWITRDEASS